MLIKGMAIPFQSAGSVPSSYKVLLVSRATMMRSVAASSAAVGMPVVKAPRVTVWPFAVRSSTRLCVSVLSSVTIKIEAAGAHKARARKQRNWEK